MRASQLDVWERNDHSKTAFFWRSIPALAAATLLTAALLTLALLRPTPFAADVGAPGDAYALASFHRAEATFRWSAPGSVLLLPAAYDGPFILDLRLHGPDFAPAEARVLRVERAGAPAAVVATTPSRALTST